MAKKRRAAPKSPLDAGTAGAGAPPAAPARTRRRGPWVVAAMLLALAIALGLWAMLSPVQDSSPAATPLPASVDNAASPSPATYVDNAQCLGCHQDAANAWKQSHHARAMAPPNEQTVRGNFDNTQFRHQGVTTRFFRRGEKYVVNTDGPDGKLADFEIKYTFGVEPLQQYLIETDGGR
ncbi:MAG: hypothetical protein ACRC2B_09980, partial [Rubrivivax sp.]